jgi:murein DD-endopeptidase MepM/ murein hydrolase activator NlpD
MERALTDQKIRKRRPASELRYSPSAVIARRAPPSPGLPRPTAPSRNRGPAAPGRGLRSLLEGIAKRAGGLARGFAGRRSGHRTGAPALGRSPTRRSGRDLFPRLRVGFGSTARRIARLPAPKALAYGLAALAALASIAAAAVLLARGPSFPMPKAALLPAEGSAHDLLLDYTAPELAAGQADDLPEASSLPAPPVTLELKSYTVRAGDSLAAIAKRFGLRVDTVISVNGISSSQSVRTGTQLRIPNIDGVIYKVRAGDKLGTIAKRFNAETTRIADANDLGSSRLNIGQSLIIPGARLPEQAVKRALGQLVAWPLRGPLSSPFGYRPDPFTGVRRFHAGIDIVADSGTPVRAVMDGVVSDVGYNGNFGNYVIVTHADGYQSLYGHLESTSIKEGARVSQGATLGLSGNTGYSTGPHLHLGLFRHGLPLNPTKYLK